MLSDTIHPPRLLLLWQAWLLFHLLTGNIMKQHNLDKDTLLVPEVIADIITQDRGQADRLCEKARRHWRESEGFRRSFRRKDERATLAMWFKHWQDSESKRPVNR